MTGKIIDLVNGNAPKIVYCARCGQPIHGNPIPINGDASVPAFARPGISGQRKYYCMDCAIGTNQVSFADAFRTLSGWSQG